MIGETVSHYLLLEEIGQGGMGVVYKAQDTQLGRAVALKFLPPSSGDQAAASRFEREAQTASSLNHPNILTIYEFGQHDGRRFIATEYVDGESLRDRLSKGPLAPDDAMAIARQVAAALTAAHEAGIVHRDIKPENVMIRPDGLVKLLDFGLAKLVHSEAGADEVTKTMGQFATRGVVIGTLPYMAPEHLRGLPVDGRADVYATGVMLFEMVTGLRPFRHTQPVMLTDAILHEPPEPPRTVASDLPPALEAVILKCLEKAPPDRYQSASDLAADLDRVSTGRRPTARTGVRRAAGSPHAGRAVGIIAVVLVAIAAATVAFDVGGWRSRFAAGAGPARITSLAVLPFDNLAPTQDQDYFAEGMTDELISRLSRIGALRVISRTSAMTYRKSQKPLAQIVKELGVDAIIEGSVLRSQARVRINVRLIEAATERPLWSDGYERDLRDVLALQGELAGAIVRQIRITVAPDEQTRLARSQPVSTEAYELFLKGREAFNQFTPEALDRAAQYFQAAIDQDDGYAPAYAGLADALAQQAGRGRPPSEVQPLARAAALRAISLEPTLGEGYMALGQVQLFYDFDWKNAGEQFATAARLTPGSPIVHQFYGLYLASAGRLDEALDESSLAVQLDPRSPGAVCIHARLLYYARRYDEAVAEFTRMLASYPDLAGSCAWLGYAYLQTSRLEEAVRAGRQAAAASPNEAQGPAVLARAYGRLGRTAEATRVIDELVARSKRTFVSPYNIGVAYIGHDDDRAIDLLSQAFAEDAGILVYLNVDPGFDPLRSHPRFQALVRRIGLPNVQ